MASIARVVKSSCALSSTTTSSVKSLVYRSTLNSRNCYSSGVGLTTTSTSGLNDVQELMNELRQLDTACLCDADKTVLSTVVSSDSYHGLVLIDCRIRPINQPKLRTQQNDDHSTIMVGIARTVKLTKRNDFLAVLRGLDEAKADEVLIVDTIDSNKAVAGELFTLEAQRKGLRGMIVDGPMRDVSNIQKLSDSSDMIRCYASKITPYSGTIQSPGQMQSMISCGGCKVSPGDIVVGDDDGIIVGPINTFRKLLPQAKAIHKAEEAIMKRLVDREGDLISMTNFREHLELRLSSKPSNLEFRLD